MPESFADVAIVFKKLRQARSWTAAELAEKAGLPVEDVLAYESDPSRMTSRIAMQVLDAVPLMVLGGEEMLDNPVFPTHPPRHLEMEMGARVHEWKAALEIDHARFREALKALATHWRCVRDRERLQLLCLEGRIAAGLGEMEEAIGFLRPAREELLAAGKLAEAGCVSLDMAAVLAAQGRCTELAELARQMEDWGQAKELSDSSRSTLRLFCRTVARGNFKPETGRRFAADFRKTDTRLTRPFEIPGEQSNGTMSSAVLGSRDRIGKASRR